MIFLILAFAIQSAFAQEVVFPDKASIQRLEVSNRVGEVVVLVDEREDFMVRATKAPKYDEKKCKFTLDSNSDALIAKVEAQKSIFDNDCEVHWRIYVPRSLKVNVDNGVGNVRLDGLKDTAEIRIGKGDLRVNGGLSLLNGKIGKGNVEAKNFTGRGEVDLGVGNVHVNFSDVTEMSALDLRLGTGDATVYVPQNSFARSIFQSGVGQMNNETSESIGKPVKVTMRVGVGNLNIKKQQ